MNERTIEAILFDLDGVLINSFESWYQAFNNADAKDKRIQSNLKAD
jgi:beta-phosphoglucomutase-like phosphatase (HAD superfamily)